MIRMLGAFGEIWIVQRMEETHRDPGSLPVERHTGVLVPRDGHAVFPVHVGCCGLRRDLPKLRELPTPPTLRRPDSIIYMAHKLPFKPVLSIQFGGINCTTMFHTHQHYFQSRSSTRQKLYSFSNNSPPLLPLQPLGTAKLLFASINVPILDISH